MPSICCSFIALRRRSIARRTRSASWTIWWQPVSCATTGSAFRPTDEALDAMRHPGVQSIQIIFNMFRLKPAERVLPEAAAKQVGILARVPLASGLLTGKLQPDDAFSS